MKVIVGESRNDRLTAEIHLPCRGSGKRTNLGAAANGDKSSVPNCDSFCPRTGGVFRDEAAVVEDSLWSRRLRWQCPAKQQDRDSREDTTNKPPMSPQKVI